MEYKALFLNDISEDMLDDFERYEDVNKAWRIENNKKVLKDIHYIEHWDKNKLRKVCYELKETLLNKGATINNSSESISTRGFL